MSSLEARWPTLAGNASDRVLSICLLEATALAQGLDIVRINGTSFVAGRAPWFNTLGFWGPLSSETSRNAVRITRDRVKRKAALTASGIRVPQSRRFSYSQIDEAIAYGKRFRGGVIIKPWALSAGRVSLNGLTDPADMRKAITAWQQTPENGGGFLVEGRIYGPEYVFYVVRDQVHSVVRRRNRVWAEEIYRHGRDRNSEIDPGVLGLAVDALRAIPRTPFGEVRIRGRNALMDPSRCRVVSVRATLEPVTGPSPREWSSSLADLLISQSTQRATGELVAVPHSRVTAEVSATELPRAESFVAKVNSWLAQGPIAGDLQAEDRRLRGSLTGTPGELASFSQMMRTRKLISETPQTVTLIQSAQSERRTDG